MAAIELPPDLPAPGLRRLPRWGPTLLHTLTVGWVLMLFLALPAWVLGIGLTTPDERQFEQKRTVAFAFGGIMGLPLLVTLAYQQQKAWRRRALYRKGAFVGARIVEAEWRTARRGNNAARVYRVRWRFDGPEGSIEGGFAPDALQLGKLPFQPAAGDIAILVADPRRPKRHEAFGFVQAGGRAWWPGAQ